MKKVWEAEIVNREKRMYPRKYHTFTTVSYAMLEKKYTNWSTRKAKAKVSDIFTPSDEAFGLLVLYNGLNVWNKQYIMMKEENKRGAKLRIDKRFCGHKLGKGWSREGLLTYNLLKNNIEERRKKMGSMEIEEMILSKYSGQEKAVVIVTKERNKDGNEVDCFLLRALKKYNKDEHNLPKQTSMVVQYTTNGCV